MATRRTHRTLPAPKTYDASTVDLDILGELLSFFFGVVGVALGRDVDRTFAETSVAHASGKVATLLLVGANPGIRPSVVAHYLLRDRSSMVKLLERLKGQGLIEQRVSARERRAHELHLTPEGRDLVARARETAMIQSEAFFAVLDEGERAQFMACLKKLYRHHVADLPPAS